MKIRLYSDLHMEIDNNFSPDFSGVDVLVLAGDIANGLGAIRLIRSWKSTLPIILVAGNHDFWFPKGSIQGNLAKMRAAAADVPNLFFLEKDTVAISGVAFHGATLWTDYGLHGSSARSGADCTRLMNDFRKIRVGTAYSRARSLDFFRIHL